MAKDGVSLKCDITIAYENLFYKQNRSINFGRYCQVNIGNFFHT